MAAVAASSTAMKPVAASTTAMSAVAKSNTAMTAVAASSVAMAEIGPSQTARDAIYDSETALTALYNASKESYSFSSTSSYSTPYDGWAFIAKCSFAWSFSRGYTNYINGLVKKGTSSTSSWNHEEAKDGARSVDLKMFGKNFSAKSGYSSESLTILPCKV